MKALTSQLYYAKTAGAQDSRSNAYFQTWGLQLFETRPAQQQLL